jgi:hypothetical protein
MRGRLQCVSLVVSLRAQLLLILVEVSFCFFAYSWTLTFEIILTRARHQIKKTAQ